MNTKLPFLSQKSFCRKKGRFWLEKYRPWRQFHQHFLRAFFVQTSFWASFPSYVSALAPKFCTKTARKNIDEIDTWSHFVAFYRQIAPLWSPWPSLMIIKEKLTAAQETRRQRAKMMVLFIFGVRFFSSWSFFFKFFFWWSSYQGGECWSDHLGIRTKFIVSSTGNELTF